MMMTRVMFVLTIPAFVVACAPKPVPPPVIHGQPVYNKLGEQVGCENGYYIPGAAPQDQCGPPPDDCDPQRPGATFDPNCQPGGQDDNNPQVPGAAPNPNNPRVP